MIMSEIIDSTVLLPATGPEIAKQRIASFGRRFGEPHLCFAYHAAFPLGLTHLI